MKLDKKLAIARRNQDLGGAVLGVNNTHFAVLDHKRNIWWFDLPVPRLQVGQYEWLHLLMYTPETDQLLHLKVTTCSCVTTSKALKCAMPISASPPSALS